MRVNVYLPDELAATVRRALPNLNVSAVLQEALRGRLHCPHDEAVCADCAQPIPVEELRAEALSAFYVDLVAALREHINRDGTVHGAGRVAQHVAERHRIPAARTTPVPLGPQHGKRRHPSAGNLPLDRPVNGEVIGPEMAPGLPDLRAPRSA